MKYSTKVGCCKFSEVFRVHQTRDKQRQSLSLPQPRYKPELSITRSPLISSFSPQNDQPSDTVQPRQLSRRPCHDYCRRVPLRRSKRAPYCSKPTGTLEYATRSMVSSSTSRVSRVIHKRDPSCYTMSQLEPLCYPIPALVVQWNQDDLYLDYSEPLSKLWFSTLVVHYTSILSIIRKPPPNLHCLGMMRLILH